MKKTIVILFFLTLIILSYKQNEISKLTIPKNSIRLRIISNSNTLQDKLDKLTIKKSVQTEIYKLINETNNYEEADDILQNNIDNIKNIINKYDIPFKITYGYNYFPSKAYKGIIYGAGNYKSLVITLGEGLGDNFWCVLFPPLCLIDDNESTDNIEYQFYIKKLLQKF